MTISASSLAEFLTTNPSVLVVAGTDYPLDTVPASLALASRVRTGGGSATVLAPSGIPAPLAFLSSEPILSSSERPLKGVSMSVTPTNSSIAGLHYLREENTVHLIFSDSRGTLIPREQLRVERAVPSFSCAITVGLSDEQIQAFSSRWNIDARDIFAVSLHQLSHLRTLTDINAGSLCEILTRELKRGGEDAITSDTATLLLGGLIASTNNFQNERVKPQTLFAAAYLIARGADKETIIRNLYKLKPLSFLKLWGHALESFAYLPSHSVGYSWIEKEKLAAIPDGMRYIGTILTELAGSTTRTRAVIVALETSRGAWCAIHAETPAIARILAKRFGVTENGKTLVVPLRLRATIAEETRALAHAIERVLE